ncbi:MAG: CoA pyrophosphatase [Deltaproteobacteria bacterium]|nr:CoA pyrophosphatase [Deltaproteobacteria bacterium]
MGGVGEDGGWADGPRVLEELRSGLATLPRHTIDWPTAVPAAVLVPLFLRGDELRLVFTERSAHLRSHSGQISFPGGKCDDGDADAVATAIREADEELGIDPTSVHVLGILDDVPTPSGFLIAPVVALLNPAPGCYRPNRAEVAEVFEVPISTIADRTVFEEQGVVERFGFKFQVYSYHVVGKRIWGATARMVHQLLGARSITPRSGH